MHIHSSELPNLNLELWTVCSHYWDQGHGQSYRTTDRVRDCLLVACTSGVSVSVFDVGIGIRYFCRYFFTSVRYSVSVF